MLWNGDKTMDASIEPTYDEVPIDEESMHGMPRETAEGAYWAEKEMDDGGAGIEFREYESHHTGTEAIEAAIAR